MAGTSPAAATQAIRSPVDLLDEFSAEITAKDTDVLLRAAPSIPQGTRISVTFLPGETHEARVTAATLVRKLGFIPIPHISARRLSSVEEGERYLSALAREAQMDRAFVVGGDCDPKGPYPHALSLIQSGRLADYGIKRVGISGYPEGHGQIPTDVLWRDLLDKHRTLRELGHEPIITTQFTFDVEQVVAWMKDVRHRGITSTIRLGIPGPASTRSLLRFAARCGVGASTKVLQKYGLSLTRLMSVTGPDRFLTELAAVLDPAETGEVRLHLYPFGGLERTAEWVKSFRNERSTS